MEELKRVDPEVEVVWKAFELRPEPAPALDPRGEYLTRVWRDSVYPLAERLGVRMRLPPIQPRSRRAHEAAKWARTRGRFEDYNAALFRAFFERGEDIGEINVLLKLAGDLGLDERGLSAALESKEFEAAVVADEREAEELGCERRACVRRRQAFRTVGRATFGRAPGAGWQSPAFAKIESGFIGERYLISAKL